MFGYQRKSRPVELGPYPLERLKRDATVIARESARPPQSKADYVLSPKAEPQQKPLLGGVQKYLEVFAALRDVHPFAQKAPVPEDLVRRARDLKGAGYFLDASQMATCELPPEAWLQDAEAQASHKYAAVVLVEYATAIDSDNLAAEWVAGIEPDIAATRAAEIAVILSGYVCALGFDAKAHWAGATEVDLDRVAVSAGLALRDNEGLSNPYVGSRFVVAVITTEYPLPVDLPLHPSARSSKGIGYWLGTNGAVSGLERWRRARRPSHFGPYAVETLKRLDKPTTLIIDDEVKRSPSRAMFYIRAEKGDLGAKAQKERPRWAYKHPLAQGLLRLMWPMAERQDGPVAEQPAASTHNAEANTKSVKALSHYLGASITGVCEIPDYCWYSHDKSGEAIEPYHKYAVVMLIDQGQETVDGACGDDWISGSQSMRAYMRGAATAGVISETLRNLGHSARPHTNLESDVLHVPLVLLAGLGEQSRIGESALNPFLGPRFKTVVMTTDMPLVVDKPIDFGLQTFCSKCEKCARECPVMAIPFGDKVMYNGYETWKPDSERCTRYRITNAKGSACGRCIKTCPLTKDVTWDGPWLTRIGSWCGINLHWLKPYLAPIAIWLDDKMGQGNPIDAKKWWLDLEVAGEQCHTFDTNNHCVVPKNTNRRMIDPDKKKPSNHKVAYYPPEVMPPPDAKGPFLADREEGLATAARAESVASAKQRLIAVVNEE